MQMVQIAKRMESFKGYLGTEMNIRLTQMKEAGRNVINLGLGDPDVIPPPPSLGDHKRCLLQS
jgi:hypothetical protein